MSITGLSHITLGVSDLEKSKDFYLNTLELSMIKENKDISCHFTAGDLWLVLVADKSLSVSKGYSHIAFFVSPSEFSNRSNIIESSGAIIWQENSSFGDSLYFKDPDGHKLEIHSSTYQERFSELELS